MDHMAPTVLSSRMWPVGLLLSEVSPLISATSSPPDGSSDLLTAQLVWFCAVLGKSKAELDD